MTRIKWLILLLVTGMFAGGLPIMADAQMPLAGIPQFMPSESWSVEPTALAQARGLSGVKLPCMMANKYDNGYIVRLSGGAGNFLAMAIDFRQNVFRQGRKYPAMLSVDDNYTDQVKATAFSQSVLIFNLRKMSGFYQALQSGASMGLEIEGNKMTFALGSFDEGVSRLEGCYNPAFKNAPVPTPMVRSSAAMPQTTSRWEEEVTPVPARVSKTMKTTMQGSPSMMWQAKAGDDLKITLENWASRAGVDLAWQAGPGGRVVSDVRLSGTFEEAVQTLMAQNAAAMGLEANMMGNASYYSASSSGSASSYSAPQQLVSTPASSPRSRASAFGGNTSANARWVAPAGSSLQQVLSSWSKQAGVEMEWQSNQGFAVKHAVSGNGSYESALQSLLEQYTKDKIRPAAQLNNDPVSGRRVLFIQSTRVL